MSGKKKVDIDAIFQNSTIVTEAIRRAGLEAMRRHIQAGEPMVAYRDGQVVHIPPEELAELLAAAEAEMALR